MEPEALNWMQRYAGSEMIELADDGRIDRREMFRRLVGICGSAAAATAFLAACSSDGGSSAPTSSAGTVGPSSSSPSTSAAPATTASTVAPPTTATETTVVEAAGSTAVEPPIGTTGGAALSIAVDDPDVVGTDVTFPGPAGELFGYLAVPATAGTRPAILVNHEIFGLTDHIRDVARRLAKVGYIALSVDLASRAGGSATAENIPGVLTQGPIEERVADLDAGLAYLDTVEGFDGRVGVIGFCFGGGMTLSYAAAQPRVAVAVPYYGPTPDPASVMTATNAAVLANYAGDDPRVNAGIDALTAALEGKDYAIRIWDGVGHAFNNDTGGAYVEGAAIEAWQGTLQWFAEKFGP